ncbi:MAG: alpha/beta hydrolase [Bacteroidota bacterium]
MVSLQLLREVFQELPYFPRHAYKVGASRIVNGVVPHEKYTFGPEKNQYLCWFEPNVERGRQKDKVIIFYHGGAWTFGKPEIFSDRAKLFVDLGYTVVMPAHRKLPLNGYKEIREDLILTLAKIRDLRQAKELASTSLIVGGMSSGGNLAALLLLDKTLHSAANWKNIPFIGGFFCAAPLHLAEMTDSFLLTQYAGPPDTATFQQASPINYLSPSQYGKWLVVHGTKDGLVKYKSTKKFVETCRKNTAIDLEFHTIVSGSHLQSVSWAYENNAVRRRILDWLAAVDNEE